MEVGGEVTAGETELPKTGAALDPATSKPFKQKSISDLKERHGRKKEAREKEIIRVAF